MLNMKQESATAWWETRKQILLWKQESKNKEQLNTTPSWIYLARNLPEHYAYISMGATKGHWDRAFSRAASSMDCIIQEAKQVRFCIVRAGQPLDKPFVLLGESCSAALTCSILCPKSRSGTSPCPMMMCWSALPVLKTQRHLFFATSWCFVWPRIATWTGKLPVLARLLPYCISNFTLVCGILASSPATVLFVNNPRLFHAFWQVIIDVNIDVKAPAVTFQGLKCLKCFKLEFKSNTQQSLSRRNEEWRS